MPFLRRPSSSMQSRAAVLLAIALLIPRSTLANDTCDLLPTDAESRPRDGQLFVFWEGKWKDLRAQQLTLEGPTNLDFIYVVRPAFGGDRPGVLVIKTNRPAEANDTNDLKNKIRLLRKGITSDKDCKPPADFPSGMATVSTAAYEQYHDYSDPDTPELRRTDPDDHSDLRTQEDKIRAFHFAYRSARKRGCIRTDDDGYDQPPWNRNSNRAQFSFDKTVVKSGRYSGFGLWWYNPSSPFKGFADHRTQMRKYATKGGIACVPFTAKVDDRYVFRINDLEGRSSPTPAERRSENYWPGP